MDKQFFGWNSVNNEGISEMIVSVKTNFDTQRESYFFFSALAHVALEYFIV